MSAHHIELSLTELIQKTDEESGGHVRVDQGVHGAEGLRAQAETRHADCSNGASGVAENSSSNVP